LLKPGNNALQLVLDHLSQAKESNEMNNTFRISVGVTVNLRPGRDGPVGDPTGAFPSTISTGGAEASAPLLKH
jgi:hypothetical protein